MERVNNNKVIRNNSITINHQPNVQPIVEVIILLLQNSETVLKNIDNPMLAEVCVMVVFASFDNIIIEDMCEHFKINQENVEPMINSLLSELLDLGIAQQQVKVIHSSIVKITASSNFISKWIRNGAAKLRGSNVQNLVKVIKEVIIEFKSKKTYKRVEVELVEQIEERVESKKLNEQKDELLRLIDIIEQSVHDAMGDTFKAVLLLLKKNMIPLLQKKENPEFIKTIFNQIESLVNARIDIFDVKKIHETTFCKFAEEICEDLGNSLETLSSQEFEVLISEIDKYNSELYVKKIIHGWKKTIYSRYLNMIDQSAQRAAKNILEYIDNIYQPVNKFKNTTWGKNLEHDIFDNIKEKVDRAILHIESSAESKIKSIETLDLIYSYLNQEYSYSSTFIDLVREVILKQLETLESSLETTKLN